MKKLFFIPLLLSFTAVFCQEKNEGGDVTDIAKITFLNPGFSYEKRIGKFQTLYLQAFMNTSDTKTSSTYGPDTYDFYFDPAITAQYRYYYNSKRREEKGLRTSMNNLNYIGPVYQVFFSRIPFTLYTKPAERRAVQFAGAVWGIQRNYSKARFALDINVGPGVLFTKTTFYDSFNDINTTISQSQFTVYSQLNLGFWLNKREKSME